METMFPFPLGGLERIFVEMSTAICRVFTKDGFVVAADGRKSGEQPSDNAQKVFSFGDNVHLSYAFIGTAELGPAGSLVVLFRFVDEVKTFCETVSTRRSRNLLEYALRMANRINRNLGEVLKTGRVPYPDTPSHEGEPGFDIADVLIDGYFDKRPSRAKIRFFHENEVLAEPSVVLQELSPDQMWFYGMPEVCKLMDGGDPRFSRYRGQHLELHQSRFLNDHINEAKCYLEACSGPEAFALNPTAASTIGGRLHIATITPAAGFEWVRGFESIPPPGLSTVRSSLS